MSHRERSWKIGMWRGMTCRCPSCGMGKLFSGFLKVQHICSSCGKDLSGHRADDAPPYFTMMIVGHIVVPVMLLVEKLWAPDLWVHLALWLPLTLGMSLALLPLVKGAIIGLQWAFRMHGFAEQQKH